MHVFILRVQYRKAAATFGTFARLKVAAARPTRMLAQQVKDQIDRVSLIATA
ncbi:hypothetical protein D9M71_756120 [compost metagenome]